MSPRRRPQLRDARYYEGEVSEPLALDGILKAVAHVRTVVRTKFPMGPAVADVLGQLEYIADMADRMRMQVGKGVHTNPPLVVFGNPPYDPLKGRRGGLGATGTFKWGPWIGDDVHDIRYTHHANGKDFEHKFSGGTQAHGVVVGGRRDILLADRDGLPLWRFYEE